MNISLFNRTARTYALSSLLAAFLASTSPSFALPVVTAIEVSKNIEMLQTGPATVAVNFAVPGGGPYGFSADVDGQDMSLLSPTPRVTGPIVINPGFQNGGFLGFNPHEQRVGGLAGWRYGAPGFTDFGTTSLGLLDALFHNGTYNLTVDGTSFSLNLSTPGGPDMFPNTPILSLGGGVWSGGKYLINPSQALTITTNAFSAYGQNPDDSIVAGWGDILGDLNLSLQFFSDVPGTNFLTFTVPALTFTAGHDYEVGAAFRLATDSSNAIAGSHNDAFFSIFTGAVVSAVPQPASLWLVALGLAGLCLSRRRKSD